MHIFHIQQDPRKYLYSTNQQNQLMSILNIVYKESTKMHVNYHNCLRGRGKDGEENTKLC